MSKKRSAVQRVVKQVSHCASNPEAAQFVISELLDNGELLLSYLIQLPRPARRGGRRNARTGPKARTVNPISAQTGEAA